MCDSKHSATHVSFQIRDVVLGLDEVLVFLVEFAIPDCLLGLRQELRGLELREGDDSILRQKLAEVIELAPQLLDLGLDAVLADGNAVELVLRGAVAALQLAPDLERPLDVVAPQRDLAPALLLASLDELGHLVRPAQDLGWRRESHGEGAHERRLSGAVRPEDDVQPRAGLHLDVGVGHEVVQLHLHHRAGLVLGGMMARSGARALSVVAVRVDRGGGDGRFIVEVEVLGGSFGELRHPGTVVGGRRLTHVPALLALFGCAVQKKLKRAASEPA